jgi:hypothetical protein
MDTFWHRTEIVFKVLGAVVILYQLAQLLATVDASLPDKIRLPSLSGSTKPDFLATSELRTSLPHRRVVCDGLFLAVNVQEILLADRQLLGEARQFEVFGLHCQNVENYIVRDH